MSAEDRTPARSLGGRFTEATDALLERINRSVDVDRRLWDQDVRGSKAHATMLAHVGLISADEARAIVDEDRGTIIGATFVGTDVAELVQSATIAIVGEVPLTRLWHAVPSYPTVSEVWLRLLETYGRPTP